VLCQFDVIQHQTFRNSASGRLSRSPSLSLSSFPRSLRARKSRVSREHEATRVARATNLTNFDAYESRLGFASNSCCASAESSRPVRDSFSPPFLTLRPRSWNGTTYENLQDHAAPFTSLQKRSLVRKSWIDLNGSSVAS